MAAKADLTVVLTFDIDAETLWTSRDRSSRIGPVMLSQGAYGPVIGVPRILRLLKRFDITATFFITGFVADHYPDECRQIVAAGHEVGHHNYGHEWPSRVDAATEREGFVRGLAVIERLTGKKPTGYRAPGWEFSDITFELLRAHGIEYSSNMMDEEHAYEFTIDGERTGIVELPCSWVLDDAAFFMYGLTYGAPQFAPSQVLEQWQAELDGMLADGDGRVYVLTMHPQMIGRASRISMLESLIAGIRRRDGVVFMTAAEAVAAARRSADLRTREFDGARSALQSGGCLSGKQGAGRETKEEEKK